MARLASKGAMFRCLALVVLLVASIELASSFKSWGRFVSRRATEVQYSFGGLIAREGSMRVQAPRMALRSKYGESPKVQRLREPEDRMDISELSQGQKIRGRIISVADYGLFVDVGTTRDGLVHIKDISTDYFISNLHSKFVPGQDIDVWVKFALSQEKKLGLQMFPCKGDLGVEVDEGEEGEGGASRVLLNIGDLQVGQALPGKVVKASDYGVFVDIGMDVLAFLHRRKMKSNRRQRKYKPWEVTPVGSEVVAYVHEISLPRHRVGLTTYTPDLWETRLPIKEEEDEEDMVDDDEELGGDTRAANLRALERTMALSLEEDEDDDDEGEDLTAEEIARLTAAGRNTKLLIDDLAPSSTTATAAGGVGRVGGLGGAVGGAGSSKGGKIPTRSVDASLGDSEELETEELFALISNGRDWVTLSDLKRWGYVKDMLLSGDLTGPQLQSMFMQAGASQGKLDVDRFEEFVEIFTDTLGLQEDDGEEEEDEEEEEVEVRIETQAKASKPTSMLIDDFEGEQEGGAGAVSRARDEEEEEEEDFLSLDGEGDLGDLTSEQFSQTQIPSQAETQVQSQLNSDLLSGLFNRVGQGKGFVEYADLVRWDLVKTLISGDVANAVRIRQAYADCIESSKGRKGVSGGGGGGKKGKKGSEAVSVTGSGSEVMGMDAFGMLVGRLKDIELLGKVKGGEEEEEGEGDDFEEISVDEAFQQLSVDGDGEFVTLEAVMGWDLVAELLEEGLPVAELEVLFEKAMGSNGVYEGEGGGEEVLEGLLDLDGFDALLDLLGPYAEGGGEEEGDVKSVSAVKVEEVKAVVEAATSAGKSAKSAVAAVVAGKSVEEEEETDEQLLLSAFTGLANGKKHVSVKDLQDWDFVYTLLAEGLLTEDTLREKVKNYSPENPKGLSFAGFDRFVDDLVQLYKESEDEEEDDEGNDDDDEEDDEDDGDMEDEDVVEIDTVAAFAEMSKGRGFVTLKDVKGWEAIQDALSFAGFLDSDWKKVLEVAGVKDPLRITPELFEALLDEVLVRTGFYEEGEDDDDIDDVEIDDILL